MASETKVLTQTAPEKIWLQLNPDGNDFETPFPANVQGITWCAESIGGEEVEYVRADRYAALLERVEEREREARRAALEEAAELARSTYDNCQRPFRLLTWRAACSEVESRILSLLPQEAPPPQEGAADGSN